MTIGILSLTSGIIGIIIDGVRFVYIPSILIGTVSLFQYRSYSHFGYVTINEKVLTVNNGLHKAHVQLDEIKRISQKERSYILVLKKGKPIFIGLNFIRLEMRNNLIERIDEIQNKLNVT